MSKNLSPNANLLVLTYLEYITLLGLLLSLSLKNKVRSYSSGDCDTRGVELQRNLFNTGTAG